MISNSETLALRQAKVAAHHQRGITLVEMMVAMVVGLILLVGIVQLFTSNKQAYRIQEGANVLNENARYIMNQMQFDLRMGDHWGGVEREEVEVMSDIDSITDDCDGDAAALDVVGIFGVDGDADSPIDCVPDSDYVPDSDIVVIRYAEPTRRATGTLEDDRIYVRTAIGRRAVIFQGENLADLPADLAPASASAMTIEEEVPDIANFEFRTVIYFLRPCASQDLGTAGVCDADDDSIPTLSRLTLQGTTLVEQDVIAGVEQMQLAYGIDTNGDRTPDYYASATDVTTEDDWDKVVDVRLSLLIRNNEIDVTASTAGQTFELYGGADGEGIEYDVPADDLRYRRKIYNSSIQVRNMIRG